MKKFTFLFLMLFGVIGFAQQPTLKGNGVDNPIHYNSQQKVKAVVKTGVQETSKADIKSLGENNPTVINAQRNRPLSGTLKAKSNAATDLNELGANNAPLLYMDANAREEILANEVYQANRPAGMASPLVTANSNPEADITPTAGATETFTPEVGDHFFDPGGPGGSSTGGDPGNYPNCGCDTQTTLEGVSEIDFQFFSVFATFDYLKIYDGTDATGVLLYDNGDGGANEGDITLAEMISSHGSSSFTADSGNFFFLFHASSVVDYGGWDVEIIAAGGGGGGIVYCTPEGTNSDRFIDNFSTTGGSENISNMGSGFSDDGYGDFYDTHSVTQEQGETVEFSVDIEGGTAGFRVWVDWNQDGEFDVVDEVAYSSSSYETNQTGSISVPGDALEGDTRMRIVSHWLSTSGDVDPCETGFTYGEFEDYKFTVTTGGGGGTGGPCATTAPSNAFENGKSFTKSSGRIVANDITVVDGEDMLLESITFTAFIGDVGSGVNADNVDVFIYEDDGSGAPGALLTSQTSMVPDSQTVIGNNFGYDAWSIELDITDVNLAGEEGADTTYWIGLSLEPTDGSNTFWEYSSAGVIGYGLAYDDGTGYTVEAENEGVYTFEGTCSSNGGGGTGGDVCSEENPNDFTFENGFNVSSASDYGTANDLTVAADEDFTLTNITASIFANDGITNIDVNYYDDASGLPGTIIGSETSVTIDSQTVIGSNFGIDVNEVELTVDPFVFNGQADAETTYWIELTVTDGGNTGSVFWVVTSSSSVGNPSAQFDGGWAVDDPLMDGVYIWEGECEPMGSGGDVCSEENPNDFTFENGFNVSSASDFGTANDLTVAADEDFTLTNITASIFANDGITNIDVTYYDDASGLPGTIIGSETSVTIDSQTVIGSNFGIDVNEVELTVDPFVFNGQADAETTYWIELTVTDGGNTGSVFWVVTSSSSVGNPSAQFDGGWAVDDPLMDGVYIWEGQCDPMGGTSDDDCGQGDDSNGFENGFNITGGGDFRNADDFMVSPDNTLNIKSIELNILAMEPITSLNVNFYEDDNGAPGSTVVETVSENVPYAQVQIGSAFGYNVYAVFVEVDLDFEGGSDGATYWMQPEAESAGAFWEVSSVGTLGEPIHTSELGGTWEVDPDGNQGVFKLHCDVATPPDSECMFDITSTVEPITRVIMSDVDNSSSPDSTEALEDFTDTVITVQSGASYDVALEGFTGGNWTNYFTVFLNTTPENDWSDYETYEIGFIENSTGNDGQQATNNITIPVDLADGDYLLRVVKNFNSSPLNPCSTYSFGQGEDYTLTVDGVIGTDDYALTSFNYYPNPTSDILNLNSGEKIESVSLYNVLGQRVIDTKVNATNYKVDVSGLSTGTYLMKVTINGQTGTYKVLKQ
ncbi:MAG: GEVED domain-containing protein [Aequorivita sp.]